MKKTSMQLFSIKTPIITPGENIVSVFLKSLQIQKIDLKDGDIIVFAESAVATSEGRIICMSNITPTLEAEKLAELYKIDAREMQLVIEECDEIIGGVTGAALTITQGGLAANAGIDGSNAPVNHLVLLPKNPQKSAVTIREEIQNACSCNVGIIIGDSRTQPLRLGCVGIALGTAGIEPVEDARGTKDLFGKELKITRKAVADNLVSAAQIMMGEANESIPIVIIRNAPVKIIDENLEIPIFSKEECMYYSNISKN